MYLYFLVCPKFYLILHKKSEEKSSLQREAQGLSSDSFRSPGLADLLSKVRGCIELLLWKRQTPLRKHVTEKQLPHVSSAAVTSL